MLKKRRATFEGHKRKLMVVLDDTSECERAVFYAARRAERTKGSLVMLFVIEPSDFQHWLGVEKIMRAEAREKAEEIVDQFVDRMHALAPSLEPERIIVEGDRLEKIIEQIENDEDIASLVLAAATSKEGPGPLISHLCGPALCEFPVPITIVPGHLDDEAIEAIA
jgi:nucleotide-binding universal stress UspA family protein